MKKIFLIPLMAFAFCLCAWSQSYIAEIKYGSTTQKFEHFADLQTYMRTTLPDNTEATVTLLDDIELGDEEQGQDPAQSFIVPKNKIIILNLNGKRILEHWGLMNTNKNCTSTYEWTAAGLTSFWHTYVPDLALADELEIGYMLDEGAIKETKVCDEDIYVNALIYNQGTLRIISEGKGVVQLSLESELEDGAESANTICNDGDLTIDGGLFIGPNAGFDLPKCPVIWAYGNNSTVRINGGTFLCYEGVSDYNKGADWGPITGGGQWIIKGGIFSSDEMAGTWVPKNGSGDKTKYTTAQMFNDQGKAYYGYLADGYKAIQVPYTNANVEGYTREWRLYDPTTNPKGVIDQANDTCPTTPGNEVTEFFGSSQADRANNVYQHYRYAIKPVCVIVPKDAAEANFLLVQPNETITVADGETLRKSSIVMGDADSKIIVEAGGTLISEGDIVTSNNNNIELTMDGRTGQEKFSTLLIKPNAIQAKHPNATVTLKSKGYRKSTNPDRYAFQRFAVPTYNNSIKRGDRTVFNYSVPTAIYKLTDANAWTVMNNSDNEAFVPFRCYDMTVQAAAQGAEYVFKSELVGNGNPTLTLYNDKWNYFGNSYTAPIDVAAMISGLDENYGHIKNSVWVHNIGDDQWDVVTSLDVEDGPGYMAVQKIQPMQAFVYLKQGEGENPQLDYQSYVYNPFVGIQPNNAPKRKVANDYTRATMIVEAANGQSNTMKMYEGERFDSSFDSENNVEKLMNENAFNMYFAFEEGNLERVASDNLGNLALTLETKDETSYTVNFKNVTLEGYVLRDNLTGTETPLVSGYTYNFSAPANSKIEGRFEIVAAAHMPTAIEDVEVNANVKGIYSLTGQYLGENFHALPAGVYVINGKKVVK